MQFTSFFDLLNHGGFTVYILLVCSVLSLKIALDKYFQFKGLNAKMNEEFLRSLYSLLKKNRLDEAIEHIERAQSKFLGFRYSSPLRPVLLSALEHRDLPKEELLEYLFNKLDKELIPYEKGLGVHATLGSITPFIGLFGTVLGIIKSFSALSLQEAGNYALVISGIAEALIATAAGLFVAIPSVMFYNYFMKRLKMNLPVFDEAIREFVRFIAVK